MNIEAKLREDIWKAIQAHYEREDYTEAVRDAMFHICELLREKSGLADKDGTKLVDAALMGTNPAILVNKYETTTEKDIQQGIGFALKGLMQAVRNPLSHEKTNYTQDEADAIILYSNLLLNKIDQSGGTSKIDDIMDLLCDEDFTDTKEYAKLLLKEVPIKKRYDLLLELYNSRAGLPQCKLHYFISELLSSLSKAAKDDFNRAVSKSLMKCKDDTNLRMYCHYFMDDTFSHIDKLARLRIEDLLFKSIESGELDKVIDPETKEEKKKCRKGSLGTWVDDKLGMLSNKKEIIDALFQKAEKGGASGEYAFNYFSGAMFDKCTFEPWQVRMINRKLKEGDEHFYYALWDDMELFPNEKYRELFGEAYEECAKIIDEKNGEGELPF